MERDRLTPGFEFEGPAIVEQMDTTTVIPPGMSARVDERAGGLEIRTHSEEDVK
jgi:N-methylhydantoinase A/oxoprolinase/acetone carboxylase beta subunit